MTLGRPFLSYQRVKILCLALAVELLLLVGMAALLLSFAVAPKDKPPTVIQLSLNSIEAPQPLDEPVVKPAPAPEPESKPPEPVKKPVEPVARPQTPVKPKPKLVPDPVKASAALEPVSATAASADAALAEAEQAKAAAVAAAQAQSKRNADLMDTYRGKVNAAIQATVNCPLAAQSMGMSGQTKVQFDLRDAVQSNASVVASSHRPMLDTAALTAVQTARYPAPPQEFAGQVKTVTVLVVLQCAN